MGQNSWGSQLGMHVGLPFHSIRAGEGRGQKLWVGAYIYDVIKFFNFFTPYLPFCQYGKVGGFLLTRQHNENCRFGVDILLRLCFFPQQISTTNRKFSFCHHVISRLPSQTAPCHVHKSAEFVSFVCFLGTNSAIQVWMSYVNAPLG